MNPLAALLSLPAACANAPAPPAQDAEAATHEAAASTPQISFEERSGDFLLRQYQLGCLSQLTYLLGAGGQAVVVDPQRDVDHYLRDAAALGLAIKAVILTHTNADFVAGHTELAQRTGAEILISAASGSQFPHRALHDGDRYALGPVTLEFWATPGHTLDAMTTVVRVPGAAADPAYALTGDTLFLGSIGRPDLVGGEITPVFLAHQAYDSVQRLLTLPDGAKILPAHGAGSLCGAHLSPETVSTMGAERATNPYLQPQSRAAFVSRTIRGLPQAPQYFRHNVALNRQGPPVLEWSGELPPALTPEQLEERLQGGAWLVDLRSQKDYALGHLPGAVNIALRGRVDTWLGTVVPFDADVYLVGSEEEVREGAFRFRRIGYDTVRGYLAGGMEAWARAGKEARSSELLAPQELRARMEQGSEPLIVDVRTEEEFEELRLPGSGNIPVTEWQDYARVLDPTQPVLFACNSAYRSSMAVGLAERLGFQRAGSLDGGLDRWVGEELPVEGEGAAELTASGAEAGASAAAVAAAPASLPETMDAAALARALLDQPQRYALFDLRAAHQYAEFHLPGSRNVTPGELEQALLDLPAGTRVVLLDRDGTLAFAFAGALLARHPRLELRVLLGGTAGWWREQAGGPAPIPMSGAAPAAPAAAAPPPPPAPAKPAPKLRSAGC